MDYVDGEVPDDVIHVDLTEEEGDWMRETDEYTPFSELSDEEAARKARYFESKLLDLYLQRVQEADYDNEEAASVRDQGSIVEDTLERGAINAEFVDRMLQAENG